MPSGVHSVNRERVRGAWGEGSSESRARTQDTFVSQTRWGCVRGNDPRRRATADSSIEEI